MHSLIPPWQKMLIILGVPTAIVVLGLIPGWTQSAYEWLWMNTTDEPYTFIMRRNPHLLFIPSFVLLAILAWCLPPRYWARILVMWATYALGLVAGHVVWGDGVIHLPS